jgi:hypothetical protein
MRMPSARSKAVPALSSKQTLKAGTALLLLSITSAHAALLIHTGAPDGKPAALTSRDASLQLIVTDTDAAGRASDATRAVKWSVTPPDALAVSANGTATPLRDGDVTLTATTADGAAASTTITISNAGTPRPLHFSNDVVPILTKYGCNGGGCHGKSEGQNGFKLSLLGFEPADDYGYLVFESRGRRLFPAAPESSLLLLKATGEMPHGGGARMTRGTPDYQTLVRWMEQGMPKGDPKAPSPVRLTVFPAERLLTPNADQQLQVSAHYADGSWRDVTTLVTYESGAKEMATVNESGLVRTAAQPGDVAVMIRFMEHVGVFRATIPLGAPLAEFPPERNVVDQHVFAKLRTLGLPPSGLCDDATFLRRVTIDIAGRLPKPDEAAAFAADASPDKRAAAVDRLLASPDYAEYFAGKWSSLLRNKRSDRPAYGTHAFHEWIRDLLNRNRPYSELASGVVSASGTISTAPAVAWYRVVKDQKDQLQDIAQVFCGQRLQCAQCHHHPYEKWSENDYYGFAAFFSTMGRKPSDQPAEEAIFHQNREGSAQNPRTGKSLKPTPLGEKPLALEAHEDPRQSLAAWMTAKENPFFARMFANRYWKHFFSRALVEPEDDMRVTNPPVNPALLDALAAEFTKSGHDMKAFIRLLCTSSTYQLSSLPNEHNATDRQNFSRFYPRRLQAEVLLDAIDAVTGVTTRFGGQPADRRAVALPDDSFNAGSYFLTVFGRPENSSACECERTQDSSLAQSLHLLNSKGLQEKLTSGSSRAAVLAKDQKPAEERISQLFLMAYGRTPEPGEVTKAKEYLEKRKGEQSAWEDMVWALLNTKEFLFNH